MLSLLHAVPGMEVVVTLVVFARTLLAAIFGFSGAAKLAELAGSRKAIADFGVPAWLAHPIGHFLPAVELAVAALLLPTPTAWWAGVAALAVARRFRGGATPAAVLIDADGRSASEFASVLRACSHSPE